MAIRIEALGGLRIWQDGGERKELPRQKLRCGFLLFVAMERTASKDRIIELLWPQVAAHSARGRLNTMVYELRESLGRDWLEVTGEQILATDQLRTDVAELMECVELGRVEEVVSSYSGPFLGSLRLVDTPAFERWVEAQRSRYAAISRASHRKLVDRLQGAGDLPAAVSAARRWALEEPLDDDAQYRLIDLLARSGLRNEAIRQYKDYVEALERIDAEPVDAVTELVAGLREGSGISLVRGSTPVSGRGGDDRPGIVVFPIDNLSPDESHQYFADGLAEEIIHVLGRVPGLRVVPRTTAFTYEPGKREGAVEQLGVTHALEGNVSFVGDRYRIRVKLIEGSGKTILWQEKFAGFLATRDVFELQDEIADQIVEALSGRLGPNAGEPRRSPPEPVHRSSRVGETTEPKAHALYLQGRHAWFGRDVPQLDRALALFEQAVEVDPTYARAHAGIADVYLVLGGLEYATRPPMEVYGRALEAAERALALAPDLDQAHAARANYLMNHEWDWRGAGDAFRHAIALNPGYSPARQWYSNYLMCLGRVDEALSEATLAREMDPRSAFLSSSLGRHYQLMRKPQRAVEELQRALKLDPNLFGAKVALAVAQLQAGHVAACRETLDSVQGNVGREVPLIMALESYARAVEGDRDGARESLRRLKATRAPYLPPEYVAIAYLGLEQPDRALTWLERSCDARSPTMTLLRMEPLFDSLRHEVRFRRLLERVGLDEGGGVASSP